MFKKSIIISLSIFSIFMIFTSIIKKNTRNIEKKIKKLDREVSILEKDYMDAKIDFIYLSRPENLKKYSVKFNINEYSTYDYSRIFLSTKEFINYTSKQTKKYKENKKNGK